MHIGMSDLSVFRFAKKGSSGWTTAAGMYVGHYMAWIAAALMLGGRLAGAFLVAPIDPAADRAPLAIEAGVDLMPPIPMSPLPFPAKLIGSSTDPCCSVEQAQALGLAWGADVSVMAGAGHIDARSGHGPWPEGLLTFGMFLKRLGSLN